KAPKKFNSVITSSKLLPIWISKSDPSLYSHESERGRPRFEFHGNDKCGRWSDCQALIDELQ
ncbi:MAG: hypothetical protein SGPRY_008063, partial [Prymnesium sp.]